MKEEYIKRIKFEVKKNLTPLQGREGYEELKQKAFEEYIEYISSSKKKGKRLDEFINKTIISIEDDIKKVVVYYQNPKYQGINIYEDLVNRNEKEVSSIYNIFKLICYSLIVLVISSVLIFFYNN